MENSTSKKYKLVSLFAGIGGFELAFDNIADTVLMCEIDDVAKYVLKNNLPSIPIISDIRELDSLPSQTDILCAGFPCQDLSSVGVKKGLSGSRSSLVWEVFRLLEKQKVEWVILENVSFMLSLRNGEAISVIAQEFNRLGYKWAYRTIDSISFVPQHRARVFVVASLHNDPRNVVLSDNYSKKIGEIDYENFSNPIGFYWTEGRSALGLIGNGIPTLKAGSTIGIPSPPAIIFPDGEISTPDIRDAETLQGFPVDWTLPVEDISKPSYRWRLVGNAVTVDTVSWIANKIQNPKEYSSINDKQFLGVGKWPKSAWCLGDGIFQSEASLYPVNQSKGLSEYLRFSRKPLSKKAILGFYNRLNAGNLKRPLYFNKTIEQYIKTLQ